MPAIKREEWLKTSPKGKLLHHAQRTIDRLQKAQDDYQRGRHQGKSFSLSHFSRRVSDMRLIGVMALLACSSPAFAAKRLEGTGFTCTASDGSVRRLNIDLRKGRYDDGQGVKYLYRVTDTKIEIEGPNPYMAADPNPYFHTVELNRTSLVLTDQVLAPMQGLRRDTLYQCVMGPMIDFKTGRRF